MKAQQDDSVYEPELYARRPSIARVFVSSQMRGKPLASERRGAVEAVEGMGHEAWIWERDARAGPYCSERVCVGTAMHSDALVLILGRRLTSITRKEYEATRDSGFPCFIFIKDGVRRDRAVNEFIREERKRGAVTVNFRNVAELKSQIVSAVQTRLVGALRERALEVRIYSRHEEVVPDRIEKEFPLTVPRYVARGFEVADDTGEYRQAQELIDRARALAGEGQTRDAFYEVYELAIQAQQAGLAEVAAELISEARDITPLELLGDEERAWYLNCKALIAGSLGRRADARRYLDQMRAAGERLDNDFIVSTALQNLGIHEVLEGNPSKAVRLYEQSIRLKMKMGDYYGAGQVFLNLAMAVQATGQLDLAERMLLDIEKAVRSLREPGLLVTLHGHLGHVAVARSEYDRAERHFQRALALSRGSAANPEREVIALQNLGSLAFDRGEPGLALRRYARALRLATDLDIPLETERLHRSRAHVLHSLGRLNEAAAAFKDAAYIAEALEDPMLLAVDTANLGAANLAAGDMIAGEARLNDALDMFAALDETEWQSRVLANLATLHQANGDVENAVQVTLSAVDLLPGRLRSERHDLLRTAAERALAAEQHVGAIELFESALREIRGRESRFYATQLAEIAALLRAENLPLYAVGFYTRALKIFKRLNEPELIFRTLNDRAIAYSDLYRFTTARRDLSRCLVLAGDREDRSMEQQARANIAEVLRREGRIDDAVTENRLALSLARRLCDRSAELGALGNLGLALFQIGELEEAESMFRQEAAVAKEVKDRRAEASGTSGLASIAFERGKRAAAARLFSRALKLRGGDEDRHFVENLAQVLETAASLGRYDDLEPAANRLVEAAQRIHAEDVAATGFARSARRLIDLGDSGGAADFFAAAIVTAAVGVRYEGMSDSESAEQLARAFLEPVGNLLAVGRQSPVDARALYDVVLEKVTSDFGAGGKAVAPYVRDLIDAVENADFERSQR